MLLTTERPRGPGYDDDATTNRLPDWVVELREHQIHAVNEIVDAFARGTRLVILDAPVGSGKTLIGELVRREMQTRALYLCSDLGLQDQVEKDFPYARVLKGRSNYPTELQPSRTAEDCSKVTAEDHCFFCNAMSTCPYQIAKAQVKGAQLGVTNTSMFLHAANYAGFLNENRLVIADECDLIEDALMGFAAYEIPEWAMRATGLEVPVKGARKNTLVRWLGEFNEGMKEYKDRDWDKMDAKRRRAVDGLLGATKRMRAGIITDMEAGVDEDARGSMWFRDYETYTFKMRPVMVKDYGRRLWWRHADRWLLMSGTVVSGEEVVESLGWEGDWSLVTVPTTFPAENRPIMVCPVADVTRTKGQAQWDRLVYAIEQILAKHPGERVLVHTVSYKLSKYLHENVDAGRRRKVTHETSQGKRAALGLYLSQPGAVLFSPSMMRGVDLKGDACRVQIIAKVPFPSLGDKQVSLRLHEPGGKGQFWYAVKTVRDVVQMSGRGVRSETDHAVTYILDAQFSKNVWSRYKALFTKGFTEVVQCNLNNRWLMPEWQGQVAPGGRSA